MRSIVLSLLFALIGCATSPRESVNELAIEAPAPDAKSAVPATQHQTMALNALSGSGPGWGADTDGCMQYNYSAAGGHLLVPLAMPEGSVVDSVTVQLIGDGMADIDVSVLSLSSTMLKSALGTVHISNPPPMWAPYVVPLTPGAVPTGGSIFLDIEASAVNPRAGTVTVQYR
jgi:hypothetical protein